MKRAIASAAAAVFLLSACGGNSGGSGGTQTADSPEDVVIAWISPDATSSTRWDTQDRPAFEAAVQDLAPGAKVIASTASTDQEMLQQAESAVTQGAQVIVINPVTAEGSLPVVDLAKREHVSVISYE